MRDSTIRTGLVLPAALLLAFAIGGCTPGASPSTAPASPAESEMMEHSASPEASGMMEHSPSASPS